jgi:hypothetical protein
VQQCDPANGQGSQRGGVNQGRSITCRRRPDQRWMSHATRFTASDISRKRADESVYTALYAVRWDIGR